MPLINKKVMLYPNASWYFALAMVATWVGFSTSYFAVLRQTDIYHHFHGFTVGLWIVLIIVQPLLYKRGKLALHRRIGWIATIVLVPLLLLGGLKMMQLAIQNQGNYPPGVVYQLSYIDLYSLMVFLLFFGLSIYNGKSIHPHARYMVCTVLTILPPAITRLLFLIPWFDSFAKTLNGSFAITEIILLLLIADDKRMGQFRKPYFVALAIFAVLHLTMNYAGNWAWWHSTMDWYANLGK